MDKRKTHGGSRKGAGRKKGSGFSGILKKYVDDFMFELLENETISNKIKQDLIQLSITDGWIYLIKDKENNYIKIGVTQKSNPNQRLSQYLLHNMDIDLLFIDRVEDCFELENEIHIHLEKRRVKGDWFNLNKDNILNVLNIINKHKHKKIYNGRW